MAPTVSLIIQTQEALHQCRRSDTPFAYMTVQGFTQWPTYPQLLVNGELLGGCDIVMEMQQDGSLKTAVQEALGSDQDDKSALQQRLKQLLDSSPVMLFMKVSACTMHDLCSYSTLLDMS